MRFSATSWLNPYETVIAVVVTEYLSCVDRWPMDTATHGSHVTKKRRVSSAVVGSQFRRLSLGEIATVLEMACRFLGDWFYGRICRAIPIMFFHHPFARSCINLSKMHTTCCRGVYNVSTVDGVTTYHRFPHIVPSVWFPFLHRFSGRGANDWHCTGRDMEGAVVLVYATGGYPAT